MTKEVMNAKVDQIRALESRMKALEKETNALKDELKAELDSLKVDSVNTGLHKIFWNIFERTNVDVERLKADGLYDKYSTKSVTTQFKITDVKA